MEKVEITREQLRVIISALIMQAIHCKEEAVECARLGLNKAAKDWIADSEAVATVSRQLWSL